MRERDGLLVCPGYFLQGAVQTLTSNKLIEKLLYCSTNDLKIILNVWSWIVSNLPILKTIFSFFKVKIRSTLITDLILRPLVFSGSIIISFTVIVAGICDEIAANTTSLYLSSVTAITYFINPCSF